jgi:hypothetical protein
VSDKTVMPLPGLDPGIVRGIHLPACSPFTFPKTRRWRYVGLWLFVVICRHFRLTFADSRAMNRGAFARERFQKPPIFAIPFQNASTFPRHVLDINSTRPRHRLYIFRRFLDIRSTSDRQDIDRNSTFERATFRGFPGLKGVPRRPGLCCRWHPQSQQRSHPEPVEGWGRNRVHPEAQCCRDGYRAEDNLPKECAGVKNLFLINVNYYKRPVLRFARQRDLDEGGIGQGFNSYRL